MLLESDNTKCAEEACDDDTIIEAELASMEGNDGVL